MTSSERGEAEYLLYEVVRQNQKFGDDLLKTDFNKRSFITKKELEDEGFEVSLPVFWYEHGIMVDLEEVFVDFIGFERKRYSQRSGNVAVLDEDISESDFQVEEDRRGIIQKYARKIARRYQDVYDTTVAKDRTYEEFADNDFIRELNDLRYFLQKVENVDTVAKDTYAPTEVSFSDILGTTQNVGSQSISEEEEQEILNYLDQMLVTYPGEKYSHMYPLFLDWESLTRQFTYNGMVSQLSNFTSSFWNTFSRVELRIHHNEDVPSLKIKRWERERPQHIEKFEKEIEDKRSVLLDNREDTDELGVVNESFSESVEQAFLDFRSEQ